MKIIEYAISILTKIDVILDKNKSFGCPNCGYYRLKFREYWECPQSSYFCGIYDRLGKRKIKEPWDLTTK